MINKAQLAFFAMGISMMVAAWLVGFNESNWIAFLVLGGVGSGTFIVGTQRDR